MRRLIALLAAVTLMVPAMAGANDYGNADYARSDLDSMTRSSGRQQDHLTSAEYHQAFAPAAADSFSRNALRQANDAPHGRVYGGLAQVLPGGAIGDPEAYDELDPIEVAFVSRTGAKLNGRIWNAGGPTPKPGAVITTGSIQGSQHMYWWAARELARRGYVVLTWDVQGQGESDSFGHSAGDPRPGFAGFPSQQAGNFTDGTIDALRFFLSTPGAEYRPQGWTEAQAAASKAAANGVTTDALNWSNPLHDVLDPTRLGIAGHSLGGSAVGLVQQCSDEGNLWQTLPLCGGRSFPIRAAVGWDSLGAGSDVTAVVPGMDQQGDGYFFNPTPSFTPPNPAGHLSAFNKWTAAGLDSYALSIRGGTHLEWTEIPYILPATSYGTALANYYTAAWFDRWVSSNPGRRQAAYQALRNGPGAADDQPSSAAYFSVRYRSAMSLTNPKAGHAGVSATDLRAYAGRSAVGDWAGANADCAGSQLPDC